MDYGGGNVTVITIVPLLSTVILMCGSLSLRFVWSAQYSAYVIRSSFSTGGRTPGKETQQSGQRPMPVESSVGRFCVVGFSFAIVVHDGRGSRFLRCRILPLLLLLGFDLGIELHETNVAIRELVKDAR